jgi:outer membrane immunogenic protein
MSWKCVLTSLGILALFVSAGFAQELKQELKSEVNVEGLAAITKSNNNVIFPYSATKSGGFMAGYRYHMNRWFAIEGDYGYTRNTQNFLDPLNFGGVGVQTNVHELTGAAVFTANSNRRVRPYALVGGGGLFFRPVNNTTNNVITGIGNAIGVSSNVNRPAFLYGGGVDFDITRYMAFRAEYRGFVFKAPGFDIPGLGAIGLNSSNMTHMAQPAVGLVWRF